MKPNTVHVTCIAGNKPIHVYRKLTEIAQNKITPRLVHVSKLCKPWHSASELGVFVKQFKIFPDSCLYDNLACTVEKEVKVKNNEDNG